MFTSIGTARYSPKINGSLDRRDGGSTKWWLILDVDPELGRYCRKLYEMYSHGVQELQRPAWEVHISVICNEEPANTFKHLWNRHAGEKVEFAFSLKSESNETYVWLPVECPIALDMREELGLCRQPSLPLHLTIGNTKIS